MKNHLHRKKEKKKKKVKIKDVKNKKFCAIEN